MEPKKHTEKTSFRQQDKIMRELLNTPNFRTLTCTEDKERNCRKVEQDKLNRHCVDNYRFDMMPHKTAKSNSIMAICNKSKIEYFNEFSIMTFYDLITHNRPTMNIITLLRLRPKT